MTEISDHAVKQVENFSQTLERFNQDANKTSKDSFFIQNQLFSSSAKIDHILFKHEAYSSVLNDKLTHTFVDHKQCKLAQWYQTSGSDYFGKTDAFKTLDGYHHIVHKLVLENMKYVQEKTHNNKDIVPVILENFVKIEDASEKLFESLDTMVVEKKAIDSAH